MAEEKEQVEEVTIEESSLEATKRWRDDARRKRIIIISAAALVLALIIFGLVWRSRKGAATTEEAEAAVVSVRVGRAEKQTIATQVNALGTIFPRDTAQVSAKISAQIKQMPILKNRVVHAGDVVAVLESRDLQAQRGEAAA